MASRIPALRELIHPRPLILIRNGQIMHANMRRERVSDEELWSGLRLHGVRELREVETAYLEGDGKISVFRRCEGTRRRAAR